MLILGYKSEKQMLVDLLLVQAGPNTETKGGGWIEKTNLINKNGQLIDNNVLTCTRRRDVALQI